MRQAYFQDDAVTIYHGDCRELLEGVTADLVVADPPYGETSLKWDKWQDGWTHYLSSQSMFCFGTLRMFMSYGDEFGFAGWKLSQELIWKKHNGSNFHADRFRRIHEGIAHFYKGEWKDVYKVPQVTMDATKRTVRRKTRPTHTGHIESGSYASSDGGPRLMTSVIEARSCHGSAVHPTQKPVKVLVPLIEYGCPPGGTVLDPFGGSGSTAIAARDIGRKCVLIEANESYCEAAANRLRQGVLPLEVNP